MENKEKKENTTPSRTLKITYKGSDYDLTFPNTGELMELAILKAKLSDGNYGAISNNQLLGDKLAQFSIDTICHLNVLCPDLIKHLNAKSYLDLDLIDMKKLIRIYIDSIFPWMNSWYEVLNSMDEE